MMATNPEFLRSARAITAIQRFSGALNLNVHFHSIYMDGVFVEDDKGEEIFKEYIPSHDEVVGITRKLKHREGEPPLLKLTQEKRRFGT